jgi:hypothetical protein
MTNNLAFDKLRKNETYKVNGEVITLTKEPNKKECIELTYKYENDNKIYNKLYDSSSTISHVEKQQNDTENNKPLTLKDISQELETMKYNYYYLPEEEKIMRFIRYSDWRTERDNTTYDDYIDLYFYSHDSQGYRVYPYNKSRASNFLKTLKKKEEDKYYAQNNNGFEKFKDYLTYKSFDYKSLNDIDNNDNNTIKDFPTAIIMKLIDKGKTNFKYKRYIFQNNKDLKKLHLRVYENELKEVTNPGEEDNVTEKYKFAELPSNDSTVKTGGKRKKSRKNRKSKKTRKSRKNRKSRKIKK